MWIYPPQPEDEAHPNQCRGCKAPVIWVVTKTGAKMPVDPGFRVLSTQLFGNVELIEVEQGASHFATCPEAQQFKKGRAA